MRTAVTSPSADADKTVDFRDIQYRFTQHIRDPETNPAPADIEDRRMQIYRDLLYNNVEDFIAKAFPVLRKLTSDEHWHLMMREYFSRHQARTPLFPKMSQEFLQYLESEREFKSWDYAFTQELAHYEWVELAIAIDSRDIQTESIDPEGDLMEGSPVLSQLAWAFSYEFPVHRISPDYLPDEPPEQKTYLVVYRNREDEVGFLELNPVSAKLVELLQSETPLTGRQLLMDIAEQLNHPQPEVVINGGMEILESLRSLDIILGTRLS